MHNVSSDTAPERVARFAGRSARHGAASFTIVNCNGVPVRVGSSVGTKHERLGYAVAA